MPHKEGHFSDLSLIFSPTREFSFRPSAYQKETKAPGFAVASFVPGQEIIGWCSYDEWWSLTLLSFMSSLLPSWQLHVPS